ncbi:hypothetical protein CEXT_227741 [Caerostris extrusa]|uniref:Uncharacterized protein n=1 Tax=Caerostris extrusa TaxID=172846 RepID=A0AAV4VFH6_CAEEX|nr:hypothetical protein CEXT_227741 [Caerostris extrusa]
MCFRAECASARLAEGAARSVAAGQWRDGGEQEHRAPRAAVRLLLTLPGDRGVHLLRHRGAPRDPQHPRAPQPAGRLPQGPPLCLR